MIKNNITLLAICFALFIISTGCSKSTNKTETANTNAVRSGNAMEGNSVTTPLSSPTSIPTPDSSPKTVQVHLTVVETNADLIDDPITDSTVTIKAGEASFNKKTNDDGVVLFDSVPCGNDVVITVHDEESVEDTVLHRKVECEGTQVDLGVLTRPFGGKYILEQRKPQAMGYDAIKNVWRTVDGKIVPMEKVRNILDKYMSQ